MKRAILAVLIALTAAAPAHAADPGKWELTGMTTLPRDYWQGVAFLGANGLAFAGPDEGLYRVDPALEEVARQDTAIPAEVAAAEQFNHIGDLEFDPGEGGRLVLPLECYYPFAGSEPDPDNPCEYGAFGVADPVTLAWRYHVRLDQAEIPKAMWVALEPATSLLWTQSRTDLMAYRSSDLAPGAAPLKAVIRHADAAPDQLSGAVFLDGRMYATTQAGRVIQLWSFDLVSGARRLEFEKPLVGESEGIAAYPGDGGTLHWVIAPGASASPPPTFGTQNVVMLHLAPVGNTQPLGSRQELSRIELAVTPARLRARKRATLKVSTRATIVGRDGPAPGVKVTARGKTVYTDDRGRATLRVRAPKRGRMTVAASRSGLSPVTLKLRAKR